MEIGKRIRRLRERRGMEQLELAQKVNISQSKMNKIETGFQKRIEPEILSDIARTLECTTDYLHGLSDNPHSTEEEDFQSFINNPELERWYKELPKNKEEDLQRLRKMWEIFKEEE